ncbi:TonB-dependent receptor [Collimonas sp.]|jgi:iron complex outermembrane receptor protein|uniref:TonB-dependent receptor n=1 Tax=Collimonas sp. TaxID=1963772 RepID=UPI002BB19B1D|nr:TonB-dependent receptor [Collimonas sp.]HWW06008.1 TonB-dependent receptor [Collimonas sp.]
MLRFKNLPAQTALSVLIAYAIPNFHQLTYAQAAEDNAAASDTKAVVVTGSRIPRASKEGPTSVTVITGEDIEKQGYRNVFEALSAQTQNTGMTQGADYGNTFTPAANTISLRGLGPNHTLILLNGRRIADYPVAYEGSVNFVNLANIPSALVERIEILNSGASAVYGSDAIAGVVNIITKKKVSGFDLNIKAGGSQDGGGANQRIQFTGGGSSGDLSGVFGIELSRTQPIWARQRDFMSSVSSDGTAPTAVFSRLNVDRNKYIDPGADTCGQLGDLFYDSVVRTQVKKGVYCGSGKARPAYWTIMTQNESENLFGSLRYQLSSKTELFSDLMLGFNSTENNTRGPNWTSEAANGSYFYNQNSGVNESWARRISPEEIGGATRYNSKWHDVAANLTVGIRGDIPSTSSWNYETAYNISAYTSRRTTPLLLKNVDSFFLGPRLGYDADGIAIYAPDPKKLYQPLTPDQFNSITGEATSRNKSWTQTLSLSANGELFNLPAGPVRLAAVTEFGSQGFSNTPDPQYNQGVFFNQAAAEGASGSRKRYALGAELNIPIVKQLTATVAGRYDEYSFAGRNDGKFTYNTGLEFRPAKTLLLRGNYATSFRAPDMNYIYSTTTRGYYAATTDYYRCQQAGQALAGCEFNNYSPGANYIQTGSKDLKAENGKSWSYGVVWSPSSNFDISADFWRIQIDNLVTNLDPDIILHNEANCRAGQLDINSPTCVDALARVQRNPANAPLNPNAIQEILVNPINAAQERTSGLDVSGKWRVKAGDVGDFLLKANYTKVLSHHYRQFASDPDQDLLNALTNPDWGSKVNASVTWLRDKWTSTVQVTRYGSLPSSDQTRRISPFALVNLSASYQINPRASVALIVNNVFNSVKQDNTAGWPYYPVGNYNPYGRQGWLEFNYHFGS